MSPSAFAPLPPVPGAACGSFEDKGVKGRFLPRPKPLPIPYSRGHKRSLGLTLGVSCDLGKCLIQRNRLQTGKRIERRTLDCCSGSFLEQG